MRIALPTRDNLTISGHFGRMKALIIVDIVDGAEVIRERRDMSAMPECDEGQGSKPSFVVSKITDCDVLIASGIGFAMRDSAVAAGIEVVLTRERLIDRAVSKYLDGLLGKAPNLAHGPQIASRR